MTERRITPGTGSVALESLRGVVEARRYVPGESGEVVVPLADLRREPGGPRDRQLLLGAAITVIERRDGHAFVQAGHDGYCGWLREAEVGAPTAPTHAVNACFSHLYPEPRVQAEPLATLSFGASVQVTEEGPAFCRTPVGCVPTPHLRRLDAPMRDPAGVASMFVGLPYLWGGNGRDGMDCSGLVQAALRACGLPCPGDSDLQQALGQAASGRRERGDLLFWRGHVAMCLDTETMIHANGHAMAVTIERVDAAVARIERQGGGPVIAHRRL